MILRPGTTARRIDTGGDRVLADSLGTQAGTVFGPAAARSGLRDHQADTAGSGPGRLPGLELSGHRQAGIATRAGIAATAIFHAMTAAAISGIDLSPAAPPGSPRDAVQTGPGPGSQTPSGTTRPRTQAQEQPCQGTTQGPAPSPATHGT